MEEPVDCRKLCDRSVQKDQAVFINTRIKENYMINWLVDGLPVGNVIYKDNGVDEYTIGFPLGVDQGTGGPILNNHYSIKVDYHHNEDKQSYRVVGIEVVAERYLLFFLPGTFGTAIALIGWRTKGGGTPIFYFGRTEKKKSGLEKSSTNFRRAQPPHCSATELNVTGVDFGLFLDDLQHRGSWRSDLSPTRQIIDMHILLSIWIIVSRTPSLVKLDVALWRMISRRPCT